MDVKELQDSELFRRIVKNAINKKKIQKEQNELFEELFSRKIEGGSAKVNKIKGLIYQTGTDEPSRIFDNNKLEEYFKEDADKFKKDKQNKKTFAVKLINE